MSESDIEQAVLEGFKRRIEISNGKCTISVNSLARRAARVVGLIKNGSPPRWVYAITSKILVKKGGELWDHPTGKKRRMYPIQSRIYRFASAKKEGS